MDYHSSHRESQYRKALITHQKYISEGLGLPGPSFILYSYPVHLTSFRFTSLRSSISDMIDKTIQPTVLFVCVHNAGRSQMAAGFMTSLSGGKVRVLSAGSAPKETINPVAIEAMAELGIDISHEVPKILTTESVQESDVVITMGCGDTCPFFPGKRYEDWVLEDPAGQGIEPVRIIRDEIKRRVSELLAEIL